MDQKGCRIVSRPRTRRYFLWDTFQPRFVTLSLCYQLVVIAAVAGALFIPLMMQLDSVPISSKDAQLLADHFLLLHSRFWPAVLVASILLALHGVFFSRFRRIFREVAKGDLTVRTSIRKGDYLQAEAECLGEMVKSLRDKIALLESQHAEIKPHLERLKQAVACGALREVEEEADRLRATVEQLSRSMESFRTKPDVQGTRTAGLPAAS